MIYLMRKEFGISARDALAVLPKWEVDLLVDEWNREQEQGG